MTTLVVSSALIVLIAAPGRSHLRFSSFLQEIFGPVLTVYVYPEKDYKQVLGLIDSTSPYALTGSVFAQDP